MLSEEAGGVEDEAAVSAGVVVVDVAAVGEVEDAVGDVVGVSVVAGVVEVVGVDGVVDVAGVVEVDGVVEVVAADVVESLGDGVPEVLVLGGATAGTSSAADGGTV